MAKSDKIRLVARLEVKGDHLVKGIQLEGLRKLVGLSNILYSERIKESSKFFFRREPGKRAHR